MQASARFTVFYGNKHNYAGRELVRKPITLSTSVGKVRAHLYLPATEYPPIHLHAHGGAFLMRYPQMDDFWCRYVTAMTGAATINIDYQVAPQVRYPIAQQQVFAVYAWLLEHASNLGLNARQVSVSGFSAGGNLAAALCLQARAAGLRQPALQILAVPSLNVAETTKTAAVSDPMINDRLVNLVRRTYFRDESRRSEPYASPLLTESVDGLAPAAIITAEYDALRAEGDAYAERFRAAGTLADHLVVPRADHYFLEGTHTPARELMDHMVAQLARASATP